MWAECDDIRLSNPKIHDDDLSQLMRDTLGVLVKVKVNF